jgi:hypothetical protein
LEVLPAADCGPLAVRVEAIVAGSVVVTFSIRSSETRTVSAIRTTIEVAFVATPPLVAGYAASGLTNFAEIEVAVAAEPAAGSVEPEYDEVEAEVEQGQQPGMSGTFTWIFLVAFPGVAVAAAMVSMVVFTHMGVFAPEAAADQKEGEKPPADEEHIQLVIVDEAPAVVYKELHGAALFKRAVRKVQLAHACVLVYRETLLGLSLKKRTMFRIYLKTILLPLTAVLGIHLVPVSSPLAVGWDSRWLFIVAYGFSTGFCVLCGPTVWLWYAVCSSSAKSLVLFS